jgi:[ribosomal protein S5]-alanine N-acetyltransferase
MVIARTETSLSVPGYALRSWRVADAVSLAAHLNNPNIGRNLADWYPSAGYTLADAEAWVTEGHLSGINWAITYEDTAVGSCGINLQSGFDRCNAEIGYWLSEVHWGKGVGTAVVRFVTTQAFQQLPEVSRVFAPIHAHNESSQRVCQKNRFTREGLRRLSTVKQGRAIDTIVWAAYRDTWA